MEISDNWKNLASKVLIGGLNEARRGEVEGVAEFIGGDMFDVFCSVAGIDKQRYKICCMKALSEYASKEDGKR